MPAPRPALAATELGDGLVGEDVTLEELGSGFDFIEGPIWNPEEKHLIFSDMPGDHMRRWSETEGITTFRKPSNMTNGNTATLFVLGNDQNDRFEVNHNRGKLYLHGGNGDDRFLLKTFLVPVPVQGAAAHLYQRYAGHGPSQRRFGVIQCVECLGDLGWCVALHG